MEVVDPGHKLATTHRRVPIASSLRPKGEQLNCPPGLASLLPRTSPLVRFQARQGHIGASLPQTCQDRSRLKPRHVRLIPRSSTPSLAVRQASSLSC